MPHKKTSCRAKGTLLLRTELERLYEKRSWVNAAILELELTKQAHAATVPACVTGSGLDISVKPCNLTNCRSA